MRAGEAELTRVVGNLLINSVRADGTVHIAAGHDRDDVWLAVSETCGGIPDDDLGRVFDVAVRGERARTPSDAGGGLGLAIVRGLVEAHGGRVGVRNVVGGCRFEVCLPAAWPPARRRSTIQAIQPTPMMKPKLMMR